MSPTIKLYSLNLTGDELIPLLYHATGRQFKHLHSATTPKQLGEFEKKFFAGMKDVTLEIHSLYEKDENFVGNRWQAKDAMLIRQYKTVANMLGLIRKHNLKFTYTPIISDLKKLLLSHKDLYTWFKPLVLSGELPPDQPGESYEELVESKDQGQPNG